MTLNKASPPSGSSICGPRTLRTIRRWDVIETSLRRTAWSNSPCTTESTTAILRQQRFYVWDQPCWSTVWGVWSPDTLLLYSRRFVWTGVCLPWIFSLSSMHLVLRVQLHVWKSSFCCVHTLRKILKDCVCSWVLVDSFNASRLKSLHGLYKLS